MPASIKKMPIPSKRLMSLASLGPAMQELEQKLRSPASDFSPDQMAAGWSLIQSYHRALALL